MMLMASASGCVVEDAEVNNGDEETSGPCCPSLIDLHITVEVSPW